MTYAETLGRTVRVHADGTIERGIEVPRKVSYSKGEPYTVASPPRRGKHQRFAPAGIPRGVDQTITIPHNCDNHLNGGAFEATPTAQVALEAKLDHPAAREWLDRHPSAVAVITEFDDPSSDYAAEVYDGEFDAED